jgi:hypothetical protein
MIRTLIAVPYELARLPLVIIDNSLSRRLSGTSGARMTLDRAIGSADKVAGGLIGDRVIAKRGTDRIEHSDKVRTAVRLEHEAATRREQARDTATTGTQKAAAKRQAAQARAVSGLEEADVAEARGKQQAKATAANTATAKKAAADKRAANRTATVEQRKERVTTAAVAKKRVAQRRATTDIADARKTKQAAAQAHAEAERLSDLTAARKAGRKHS